ncbi:MAG: UDP-glucose--hexose-1-phosphate uridylyltransferase [Christensenellales bacterium]
MDSIFYNVARLVEYAKQHLHLRAEDELYVRNGIYNLLNLHTDEEVSGVDAAEIAAMTVPDGVIAPIREYAERKGLVEDRILFETALMGIVTPMPSAVDDIFRSDCEKYGTMKAMRNFYDLCIKSNYIRKTDVDKSLYWKAELEPVDLEITVNLSKPEKDNKEIARLKAAPQTGFPKCMLCKENVNYQGRTGFPARQTLRYLPITLNDEQWYVQFSPYVYYNEHCIIFSDKHSPMTMNETTFRKLLQFTDIFPDYIAGSNACLPIVGGSILSHEHYQGGGHLMPIHFSGVRRRFKHPDFGGIDVTVREWYNSDIRLEGDDREEIVKLAAKIFDAWDNYSDESVGIIAGTTEPHNAVTPIARKVDGRYSLDMILRNNRTSSEYPDGIFHAHPEYHNIKKEGIGLIEAMGLFILPGRLQRECLGIEEILTGNDNSGDYTRPESALFKHRAMIDELLEYGVCDRETAHDRIKGYINRTCRNILENTAVFKNDDRGQNAFDKFLKEVGFNAYRQEN